MFTSVEPLNAANHATLVYSAVPGYGFARELSSAPLAVTELAAAARHFPIVFPAEGEPVPVALLTLRPGEAPFVGADGAWAVDYVPAHIRRYPFVVGETGEADRYVIMIDRAAPHFAGGDGEPLFVDGVAPETGVIARAREFLTAFQAQLVRTRALVKPLEETGLLVSHQITVRRGEETVAAVDGFRQVDGEAMTRLDDATLAAWVRSGLMAVVIAHLHSLGNVERLVQRHETLAGAASVNGSGHATS